MYTRCFAGLKIEINRLTAQKSQVDLFTGGRLWTFDHRADVGLAGNGVKTLAVSVHKAPVASEHTTLLVQGLDARIDSNNFLFLLPADERPSVLGKHAIRSSTIEILTAEKHHGRAYIHGIYIFKEPKLSKFGINYTGGADTYTAIGLNGERDRFHLWSDPILDGLTAAVAALMSLSSEAAARQMALDTAKLIYEELSCSDSVFAALDSHTLYSRSDANEATHLKQLAYLLLKYFRHLHGRDTIPVSESGGTELEFANDAHYLGYKTIVVTQSLLTLLRRHPDCVQDTDTLWESRRIAMLKSSDVTFNDETQKHFADELIRIAEHACMPHREHFTRILFKKLGAGSQVPAYLHT